MREIKLIHPEYIAFCEKCDTHIHINSGSVFCQQCYKTTPRDVQIELLNKIYKYINSKAYKSRANKKNFLLNKYKIYYEHIISITNEQNICIVRDINDNNKKRKRTKIGKDITNIETYLYYIKVNEYYKIGITSLDVKDRFKNDIRKGVNIKVLHIWSFNNRKDAYKREQQILTRYKDYIPFDTPLIAGNTELFYEDVLGYDTYGYLKPIF